MNKANGIYIKMMGFAKESAENKAIVKAAVAAPVLNLWANALDDQKYFDCSKQPNGEYLVIGETEHGPFIIELRGYDPAKA